MRKMLPPNYRTYTGTVMTEEEVFEYNCVQKAINAFLSREMRPCAELLNLSHHLLEKAAQRPKRQSKSNFIASQKADAWERAK